MSRIHSVIAIAVLAFVSTGCNISIFNSGEPGSGVITSEDRDVESFDKINLSGFGTVNVTFGTETTFKVTTDDNLHDFIETSVTDGELVISFKESISPTDGLVFEIKTPQLNRFKLSGAGNVTISDYSGDDLQLDTSGAGNYTVNGIAESVSLKISGAGKGSLGKLVAKTAVVNVSGAGSATVNVVDSLKVNISGAGSVSYKGTPEVSKTISGMGRVSQIAESNNESATDN